MTRYARTDSQDHSPVRSTPHKSQKLDQDHINQTILTQLNAVSDRLTKIENSAPTGEKRSTARKNKSKLSKIHRGVNASGNCVSQSVRPSVTSTSKNIPPLVALRHDVRVQQEVQARLRELADNTQAGNSKIKSQRGGAVDVYVSNRVKWPHEFVLSGHSKDRVTYNQLSPVQWMAGFCRTMRDEPNSDIKDKMLDYVINLLDDAQDFSWVSAKASHAVLLCRMEQGEITSWSETEKIDRIRRAHAQRHAQTQSVNGKNQEKNYTKIIPCVYFNKNTCLQKQTHETKGVLYKRICSACWSTESKAYPHSVTDCRCQKAKNE